MIFNKVFDHIYVINLKKSVDRREHIVNEFKRVGIDKYEFFEAVAHDSEDVINLKKSGFVKEFPSCFRCLKDRCNCENNFLTPYQLGNWCSFIKLFHDILNNKYNFVLICEDDIIFSHQHKRIIDKLLSKQTFNSYRIDMKKPLLIRMGTAFNPDNHNSNANPMFLRNYSLCNPCFAINKEMAFVYLKYLKINYHSDVYFHQQIPKGIKGIQFFTMYPYPVYELSFVKSKQKFESQVRPKNAFRRMEYKEFLLLSSNFMLHLYLLKLIKKYNLDIKVGTIGYNGNIDNYLLMDENEKNRYHFKYKILLYDNDENNLKILNDYKHLNIYKLFYNKINELYNINLNYDEIDSNINTFYENYKKILEDSSTIKINISNQEDINKLNNLLKSIRR